MATVARVTLTCDMCGNAKDVKTRMFGLDGRAYEIDLCQKDGNALGRVASGYISKARKVTAKPGRRHGRRQHGGRPQVRAATSASGDGAKASAAGVQQQKGIYVYGILPADIEVAADMPGVGEHPGLLRAVRSDGLAALISEVDLFGPLGSPDDLRAHREILDDTAVELPVVPLPFGTILASEDAVAEELLAAHHDEFAAALDQLEGCAEFQVKGRYTKIAVLAEVSSKDKHAARLRDMIQGRDAHAARNAGLGPGQLINEATTARREQDTRALRQAMEKVCVASIAREPADDLDAVNVALLVAVDHEREVERVIEDLAREWEGRIDLQLLGPMAAYDFAGTAQPES
jgi:hypothetical protein